MAVVSVNEYSASGGFDGQGRRTWTVLYKVRTNSVSDGPLIVITSPLLPSYLSSYSFQSATEGDTLAFRQSISADLQSPGESWVMWDVTAVFSTKPLTIPDKETVQDPTLLLPEISGSFVKTLVPADRDKDSKPMVNPLGDLFIGLVRDKSLPSLAIKKNFSAADFDLNLITSVSDSVNVVAFFNKGPRKWKFSEFVWRQLYWGISGTLTPYYEATFGFESNEDTWDFKPANRGPRYRVGTEKLKFKDDAGFEYDDGLGTLEVDGTERTADPRPLLYDGTTAGLDPFQVYTPIDFGAVLKVPTTLV